MFSKEIDDCRPEILMTTVCGVKVAKEAWALSQLLLPLSVLSLFGCTGTAAAGAVLSVRSVEYSFCLVSSRPSVEYVA